MTLINCKSCGTLVLQERMNAKLCNDCFEQDERYFRLFRLLIQENPQISLQEAMEKSEVPSKRIMEWVREGRLRLS